MPDQVTGRCLVCDTSLAGRRDVVCSARCRARKRAATVTREAFWDRLSGRDCAHCGKVFYPRNTRQQFCSPDCARFAKSREGAVCQLEGCENRTGWDRSGRPRIYCCNAHRQKAYRLRKQAASAD